MFYTLCVKKFRGLFVAGILTVGIGAGMAATFLPGYLFPRRYSTEVEKYAREYGLEENFVYAVIKAESNFDPNAVSYRGACGLMQIMPTTGEWCAESMGMDSFAEEMLFDPEINIQLGCWYLALLVDHFDGSLTTAAAAYNAGIGNVSRWISEGGSTDLEVIPFRETEGYLKKIQLYHKIYDDMYGGTKKTV
ncbi:MAG: lytic transglycosylase domain-containing protein [Clostridiales bacterium]|nr:lytic transglycosylase domain-containing protein [Clostridiales bacterium]